MKYKENFAEKFMKSLMGKKDSSIKSDNEKIPEIRKMLEDLIAVSDDKWGRYAFRREPLNGRFSEKERNLLISKANICGREEAEKIKEKFNTESIYECTEKLNLNVDYPDKPVGGAHILFAQFVEPNNISLFKDSLDKAKKLIEEESLHNIFEEDSIREILLAHEVFHFIEEKNDELFKKTEKIRLWKLGPLKNDSSIVALGEIAGMAFAKEFLKLEFSPYILDIFLVYIYNKEASYMLYKEVMNIK
ncbi:MAG: hypothetical protein K5986_00660 [Clostridium sp.]|nr:hypothetical protein [Clostridium sp.]